MEKILSKLQASITQDSEIKTIQVSAHWILIESLGFGMASTILSDLPHGEDLVDEVGDLHYKTAKELTALTSSQNTLSAGIGLAALNSLLPYPKGFIQNINIAEVLIEKGKRKNIVMVGHFPFAKKLQAIAQKLSIIELRPAEGEYYPSQAQALIQEADILAMTGNTLITKATEKYLDYCPKNCLKIMMGPSTPLSPLLFNFGFDILAGVQIKDPKLVLQYISQGAAFSQVKGVKKVTLSKI